MTTRTSRGLPILVTAGMALLASACASGAGDRDGEAEHRHRARKSPAAARIAQAVAGQPARDSRSIPDFDEERLWSALDDWEPTVAVSPDGREVYQATTRFGDPGPYGPSPILFRRSTDSGASWQIDQYLDPFRATFQADPQLAVAANGHLFAVWLENFTPGVTFQRSTDGGRSWHGKIALAPPSGTYPGWSDKPILVAAPNGHDLYVGFNASDAYCVASHDGGRTWTPPIQTSNDRRYWYHTGAAVAPDGTVAFACVDYRQNSRGPVHVSVVRSTDGGATWQTIRVDTSAEPADCNAPGCYFGFMGPQSTIAVDRAGNWLIAYNAADIDNAPTQLFVRHSSDGVSWSERILVSVPDPAVTNAFPALAHGPDRGDFRLVWQDDRMGRDLFNTWMARSGDGGRTFEPALRLSDRPDGASYKSAAGYAFPFGDYLGIACDGRGVLHAIWGEAESYDGPGGTWYTRGR